MMDSIIAGLIASFVFFLLGLIIKEWLWPRYVSLMYRGSRIDGKWNVYYEGHKDSSATLEFKQVGTNIIGHSLVSTNKSGETVNRSYTYKGTFLNKSIVLTFEDQNNPLMFGGAMVLHHMISDSHEMKGRSIYFKPEINDIDTTVITLKKTVN